MFVNIALYLPVFLNVIIKCDTPLQIICVLFLSQQRKFDLLRLIGVTYVPENTAGLYKKKKHLAPIKQAYYVRYSHPH